jgi:hypothetical protein
MPLQSPRPDLLCPYERVLEEIGDERSTPLDVFALPESVDRAVASPAEAPPGAIVAEAA